jgi:ring-1,2-phenylacetyl-CoA epoxidase subunit PaaE
LAKHFRSLLIKDIKEETPDCISVVFEIPDELKEEFLHKAGQNITLRATIGGEELRRTYSICSSPFEKEFRIAIKKVNQGRFSSYAHQSLQYNQHLDVMPPTGNFFLKHHPGNKKHYIAFAAGSGITPVISILKNILTAEPQSRISLFYGNRRRNDIIFLEELEAIKNLYPEKFQLMHIFSREKMDAAIFEGRIDTEKCATIFKNIIPLNQEQIFLLCGPSPMIFNIRHWLLEHHIEEKNIHYELFADPAEKGTPQKNKNPEQIVSPEKKSAVTIRLDGMTRDFNVPFSGPTILDVAISEGADLPYACRAGVCASCRAKLVSGKVKIDQNYSLADDELEQGFILACQSHPVSESLFIDFDIR